MNVSDVLSGLETSISVKILGAVIIFKSQPIHVGAGVNIPKPSLFA